MDAAAPPRHWRWPREGRWPRAGDAVTVVRRINSPWGSRLYFEEKEAVLELSAPLSTTQASPEFGLTFQPSQAAPVEETLARSDRTIMVPIGDKETPLGYIELSNSPNFGAEALTTARQAFLLAAGGASLVALLVGLVVSRGLTIPLQQLIGAANQMSSGDLSVRAPVRGNAEITELGLQFNQMAERLEASFSELAQERDTLRRFIADASHELRTPVAALRNFNELLQGPASHDPAARAEFLSESQNQLKRLEWLIDNLLNLSRLEAGLVALNLAEQDVGEMLDTLQTSFNLLAQEKEIQLEVKYPVQPLQVRCDRARFESVLSNLLDNALKFAPVGGRVELGAQQVDQAVQFWVKDNGPGIAPADQARIFERFYRGQNAGTTGGSGLGLAIAQRMVQAHGGRIFVESDRGSGSCFVVELPL
jgi:signal transduction histidine kinase